MQKPLTALKIISHFLNMIFPSACPVCEKPSDHHSIAPVCSSCWDTIERHDGKGCRICAAVTEYDSTGVCQECRSVKPVFDRVIAYGIYEGVLKEAIHLMKFRQIKRLAGILGNEISTLDIPNAEYIIPVPLSVNGLRSREFNQSAIMAKVLSGQTGIPLYLDALKKVRETLPQSSLPKKARSRNVQGAYKADGNVEGIEVLLVDDVVTTAATVNECAKVLKKAGASSVTIVTVARAKSD